MRSTLWSSKVKSKKDCQSSSNPDLKSLLDLSPYNDIQQAAFDVPFSYYYEPVNSMRFRFQRDLLEATLYGFIRDIQEKGAEATIYKDFLSHFTDEEFRRFLDRHQD